MRIGFVNFAPLIYSVKTPYNSPLGGSESAMCYLAVELAKLGHKVTLFGRNQKTFTQLSVTHEPEKKLKSGDIQNLDFLIIQNTPNEAIELKSKLSSKTTIIFWSEHASDQPAVRDLGNIELQKIFDKFILISKWQYNEYVQRFNISPKDCVILQNAISPAFENLFTNDGDISKNKTYPPTLAYTSTPFRGLDLLIEIFKEIRNKIPDIKLKIFSSMSVYQTPKRQDQSNFGDLYDLCKKTPGVEYVGSVSQTKLAKELKKVSILAYPNTFPETFCTSVVEAMAAGCQIITSDLGALPETTAGFAKLIRIGFDRNLFCQKFIKGIISLIDDVSKNSNRLSSQVRFANSNYTWKIRAGEWEQFLSTLI